MTTATMKEQSPQAVFCVAASDEVIRAAATACSSVPGFVFAGGFGDYITAEKRPQFPQSMKNASACVALIDFDRDPEMALKTAERLGQIFLKRISLIAVGSDLPSALLVRAIRAGCVEYLGTPLNLPDLAASFKRFQLFMDVGPQAQSSTGRVLAFFGAKGGVGTTTLAVHLATHLIRKHGRKTLLIDHKHQLGHVALYLGLKDTQYHFDELLRNVDRLDSELLNGYVIRHSSGLDVIASPDISTKHYECKQDEIERVMDFLRRTYDFILIDSSVAYEDTKMSIIEQADAVYLVSTPDVASLRDLVRLVEHISLSPTADGKLFLTMNRSTANESVSAEQIKKAVRFPVTVAVPNNYMDLLRSINEGEPISPFQKSPFNQALSTWTTQILGSKDDRPSAVAEPAAKKSFAFWK